MQEAMKFLLDGLGVSDGQLQIIEKIRTVGELDELSVDDDETTFPTLIGGERRPASITLSATVSQEHYTGDKIVGLLGRYNLTPTSVNDYSHHSPPKTEPLIYVTFSEDKHAVNLYLRRNS